MAQKKSTSAAAKPTKPKSAKPAAAKAASKPAAKAASTARKTTASSARGTSSKASVASGAGAVKAKTGEKRPKTGQTTAAAAKPAKAAVKPVKAAAANAKRDSSKSAKAKSVKAAEPKKKAATKPAASAPKAAKPAAKPAAAAPKAAKPVSKAKAPAKGSGGKKPVVPAPPAQKAKVASGATARAVAASIAEAAARKISTPVKPVKDAKSSDKSDGQRDAAAQKKSVSQRHGFKTNEQVVYPAHGVGRIIGIEEQEIAGMSLELFVIHFEKEKLTLRVPTGKLESVGLRKLAEPNVVNKALDVLKGRARVKRTMWSRRAQEYVAKINSGDLISIAEVVRDLYRSEAQPEQSYSERQLYEDALDRMAREVAAVCKLDERGSIQRITDVLSKSAKNRRTAEAEAEEAELEGDANEAA